MSVSEVSSESFRGRFPMLGKTIHLASCSLGARSAELDQALTRMLDEMATGGAPWSAFERELHQARSQFAALIGASSDQIAVVPNATIGAYQVASTQGWRDRSRIVTSTAEFPSIAHVWLAQRRRGAEVVHADYSPAGYVAAIDRNTRLVSIPMISFQDGIRISVAEIVRAAAEVGAQVFIDAYQATGIDSVDVNALGCDFLVSGTSKYLLGLPGVAFLYVRSPESAEHLPSLTGWFGRVDPMAFETHQLDFAVSARRYEIGTPAVAACYAANAGLRMIRELNVLTVRRHVWRLGELARDLLTEQGEYVRALPPPGRGAHIGIVDPDPGALSRRLASRGIVVSPRGDIVRVSFHYFNNIDDVTALCAALRVDRMESGHLSVGSSRQGGKLNCVQPS